MSLNRIALNPYFSSNWPVGLVVERK